MKIKDGQLIVYKVNNVLSNKRNPDYMFFKNLCYDFKKLEQKRKK